MSKRKIASADRIAITSILVSLGDVAINAVTAIITGSAVVFAQSLQGFADAVTASLLLFGVRRSKRPPSKTHPFGHGRELFFWVLLAGIMTLTISGGLALSQGFRQLINPDEVSSVLIALVVLVFGFLTNGYSFRQSLIRLTKGEINLKTIRRISHSSLIETKSAMLIDLTGTLSAATGIVALGVFALTDNARFDGFGAILIGFFTISGALLLIADLRGLIIGKSPHQDVIKHIQRSARRVPNVNEVLDLRAITVGSDRVLAIIEVHFKDDLTTDEIEKTTDDIKKTVIEKVSAVTDVQVEAETPDKELKAKK